MQFFKLCFVSNESLYLILTMFLLLHKCQLVNKKALLLTIPSQIRHKTGECQIPRRELHVHAMKIESTAEEMF